MMLLGKKWVPMDNKKRVLFLYTGNSARSQMAWPRDWSITFGATSGRHIPPAQRRLVTCTRLNLSLALQEC